MTTFENQDLSGCLFREVDLSGTNFSGSASGGRTSNPNWPDERPDLAESLRVIVNETFWYYRFAVRDLDALAAQ